jgi:hypothetical protein
VRRYTISDHERNEEIMRKLQIPEIAEHVEQNLCRKN